jgi:predicted ATP-grasp superfamily ATP-dependent carboligase
MFGDIDLATRCPIRRVDNYPQGLVAACSSLPESPWMYTGALENHPALVDQIGATRKLYGNPGHVLRRVRDPVLLARMLGEEGLRSPDVTLRSPSGGAWLRKPVDSSGGDRIVLLHRQAIAGKGESTSNTSHYYQQFVDGESCSALYVAAEGRALYLGATRQLIGCDWAGASGFRYAGSVGPLALEQQTVVTFQRIGDCLARRFGLVGIFGVDAIVADGVVWPVEVNPRYTASVEVLERTLDIQAIAIHVGACRDSELPPLKTRPSKCYCAKAILYATEETTVSDRFMQLVEDLNASVESPVVADIPAVGRDIQPGHPVVTVLANGVTLSSASERLQDRFSRVRHALYRGEAGLQ